jgi:hypothetical protein
LTIEITLKVNGGYYIKNSYTNKFNPNICYKCGYAQPMELLIDLKNKFNGVFVEGRAEHYPELIFYKFEDAINALDWIESKILMEKLNTESGDDYFSN